MRLFSEIKLVITNLERKIKLKHKSFSMEKDGFVGHLAETDENSDTAVIVIMGGEKSVLPAIKVAERFAEYGIVGLAVSLYDAEGLPKSVDRIPLDMFKCAISYLKNELKIKKVSIYGMSMGSLFAAMTAINIGEVDSVIMVSPSHTIFEGSDNKKHMTGHSLMTLNGKEFPFVKQDFENKAMWQAFNDAYKDKKLEENASIPIEKIKARILLIASDSDESWPAGYSVKYMEKRLKANNFAYDYKTIIYHNASHALGVLPNKKSHKLLYILMPLAFKNERKFKADCQKARSLSEKEIIKWIKA